MAEFADGAERIARLDRGTPEVLTEATDFPTEATDFPTEITDFTAEVTDFRDLGKVEGLQCYQVALSRSAFTLERSTGVLRASSRNGLILEAPVLAVEQDSEGLLWHTTPKPLQPGIRVHGHVQPSVVAAESPAKSASAL